MKQSHTCEIIAVGTEILLGDIVNTNASYLARRLAEMGIPLYRQTVVGDNHARLMAAIAEAYGRADTVIFTGGLGPTGDDITKETVADYFGVPLREHAPSRRAIESFFASRGRVMTENNLRQAMLPEGAEAIPNSCGTAPGIWMEREGKTAILLPGPPSEMTAMFETSVFPRLLSEGGGVLYSLNLHLAGIGESAAEAELSDIMDASENPTVSPYAGEDEVRIRVTARGETEEISRAMAREMADRILARGMDAYCYAETDTVEDAKDAPASSVLREFAARGWTLATAESCTGGLIGSRITALAGSSAVFLGSIVSYANGVKQGVLGVRAETLARCGAVSEETAAEMAAGASRLSGASVAVSVTGIAGPGGGTAEKPLGTVCFGVACGGKVCTETVHFSPRAPRERIRKQAASHALRLALAAVRG